MEGLRSFWASNGNGLGVVTAILTSGHREKDPCLGITNLRLSLVAWGLSFSMFEFQCQHSGSSPRKECVHLVILNVVRTPTPQQGPEVLSHRSVRLQS